MWLLAIDLDGTVWDHEDVTSLKTPFRRVANDVIEDSLGVKVVLRSGVKEFLSWAKEHGAIISTLSWNEPAIALEALRAFSLEGLFDYHFIEFHPRKHEMLKSLLKRVKADLNVEIEPERVIYVDDRDLHVADIVRFVGRVKFVYFGKDVNDFNELKSLLCAADR